jgi:hypothetical protein
MYKLKPFTANENGDLTTVAISITIFLVVVGYILAPVGLTAMTGVNTTAAGVDTGSAANIWNALIPLTLASLIIAVVYNLKKEA